MKTVIAVLVLAFAGMISAANQNYQVIGISDAASHLMVELVNRAGGHASSRK